LIIVESEIDAVGRSRAFVLLDLECAAPDVHVGIEILKIAEHRNRGRSRRRFQKVGGRCGAAQQEAPCAGEKQHFQARFCV
jgi:hypothetical protein